jgi:hypothetical protein
MSKHTPGPWFIWKEKAMQDEGMDKDEIDFELSEANDFDVMTGKPVGEVTRGRIAGCRRVVTLDADDFGDDEEEGRQISLANARLIAAAPDMLETLKRLSDMCADFGAKTACDMADAAIFKATGEQA